MKKLIPIVFGILAILMLVMLEKNRYTQVYHTKEHHTKEDKRWLLIDISRFGNERYIDSESISSCLKEKTNKIKVWVKKIYSQEGKESFIAERKKEKLPVYQDIYKRLGYLIIDCDTKKIGVYSNALYAKNGELLEYETIPEDLVSLEPVIPESSGEKIIKVVCCFCKNDNESCKESISNFQKMLEFVDTYFPFEEKSEVKAQILLEEAVIYMVLKDFEASKNLLKKILTEYPATETAKDAEKLLSEMK
jgi:hypothetical protein